MLTIATVDHRSRLIPDVDFRALNSDRGYETRIQSTNGQIQDVFSDRSFSYVHDIPPLVQSAFIAAEDHRFLSHHGVDLVATLRAIVGNATHLQQTGASTITQQVVKNLLIGNEKTYQRKLDEAILATRMERALSKQDILRIYLNTIYFGKGAYGIGAAARIWFGKDVAELTIPEVAFLAALPKGPRLIDPKIHPERAIARRLYVLQNMQKTGVLTSEQVRLYNSAPLPEPSSVSHAGEGSSYYTEYVRRLLSRNGVDVYHAGKIYKTWQDTDIQIIADRSLRDTLIAYDERRGWRNESTVALNAAPSDWKPVIIQSCVKHTCSVMSANSALTLINPYNGPIPRPGQRAYADGLTLRQIPAVNGALLVMDYNGHVLSQSGGFWRGNTSFDRTLSSRQTGSTIKPFVACAAIDKGWTPDTLIADVPITVGDWSPGGDGHDEGAGYISLTDALALSRNQGFVRLGMEIGFPDVYRTMREFGLYSSNVELSPASILGATETSLLNLTTAYAQIASGHRLSPSWLQDAETPSPSISCAPDVRSMLSNVVRDGTAKIAFEGIDGVSGKTGTSNQVMDGWFIGYDRAYIVGVYVGYDKPTPLGDAEFGSTLAAPAAASVFRRIRAMER